MYAHATWESIAITMPTQKIVEGSAPHINATYDNGIIIQVMPPVTN